MIHHPHSPRHVGPRMSTGFSCNSPFPGHVLLSQCPVATWACCVSLGTYWSCLQKKTQSRSCFVVEERGLKRTSIVLCNTVVIQYWAVRHIDQFTCILISVVGLSLVRDSKKLLAIQLLMWNEFLGLRPVAHNLIHLKCTQKNVKKLLLDPADVTGMNMIKRTIEVAFNKGALEESGNKRV